MVWHIVVRSGMVFQVMAYLENSSEVDGLINHPSNSKKERGTQGGRGSLKANGRSMMCYLRYPMVNP